MSNSRITILSELKGNIAQLSMADTFEERYDAFIKLHCILHDIGEMIIELDSLEAEKKKYEELWCEERRKNAEASDD